MNDITPPPTTWLTYGKEDLYSKSASLVPNFAARWHSFCKYFFTAKINNKWNKPNHPLKKKLPVYTLKRRSQQQGNPGQKQRKVKTTLRKNKKWTTRPCSCGCHIRSCSHKIFITAISSTYDEVALTKGNNGKLIPPHNVPTIIKKTYPISNRELVLIFAARWQLFHKYFSTPKINNQMKQNPNNNSHRKYPIHLEKKTSTYKKNQIKYDKNAAPP